MHCINVMTGALAKGTDTGATILIGGKRTPQDRRPDGHGRRALPCRLKTDEDYDALVELGQKVIDFFAENALEHERTGEMIERIGLVNFLEGIGVEIDPNMVATRRAPTPTFAPTAGTTKSPASPPRNPPEESREHGHDAHPVEAAFRTTSQFLHPALLKNYGNWRYHDRPRPGVLHHVAHGGDEVWSVRAGTQRQMDVHTIRKLCDIADRYAEGPCALHHPQQHRVHGQRPGQGRAADRRADATASRSAAPATRCR